MPSEESLFDIPIYIWPKAEYSKKYKKHLSKTMDDAFGDYSPSREAKIFLEHRTYHSFGGPWKFNQIIGWIQLFVTGNSLGGRVWTLHNGNVQAYTAQHEKKILFINSK